MSNFRLLVKPYGKFVDNPNNYGRFYVFNDKRIIYCEKFANIAMS